MGYIRCGLCENRTLRYDDSIFPYLQGEDEIKSSHFISIKTGKSPINGSYIRCAWCDSNLLINDMRAEWKRVRKGRDWDI